MANVLCIGGCHWDIRLIAHQALLAGESTPVTSKMSAGGAVSNVARALRSKGHLVEIASVVGNNPPEQSRLSKVLTGQESGRYITVETASGDLVHGLADLDIYGAMDAQWYQGLSLASEQFDAVVIDCNAQPQALSCFETSKPLYAVSVSPAKVAHFRDILPRLDGLFLNQSEAAVLDESLQQAAKTLKTLGSNGAALLQYGQEISRWPAPEGRPAHVNGLGDRLTGLVLHGLIQGQAWQDAVMGGLSELFEAWELRE